MDAPIECSRASEGIMDALLAAGPMGLSTPARKAVAQFSGLDIDGFRGLSGPSDGEEDLRRMGAGCILAAAMMGDDRPELQELISSWRRMEADLPRPPIDLDPVAEIPGGIAVPLPERRDLGQETLDLLTLRGIPVIAERMAEELLGR